MICGGNLLCEIRRGGFRRVAEILIILLFKLLFEFQKLFNFYI